MTDQEKSTAHEVHTLLLSAHPHSGDAELRKAEKLAALSGEPRDDLRSETLLAIQTVRKATAEGASGVEGEQLLLGAIRAAEQWVRGSG